MNRKTLTYRKKNKKNQNEVPKEKKGPINIRVMIYCFVEALVRYALLIFIEKSIVNSDAKQEVYVAVMDVPDNLLITEENFAEYFRMEDRAVSTFPEGSISSPAEIIGGLTSQKILAKEICATAMFTREQSLIANIKDPVEVSLAASNLSQVVGGVIRTGDFINIWSVKNSSINGLDETVADIIFSGAYVTRAFTSTGVEVSRDDSEESATTIINIIIPAAQEEEFNRAIADGTIRLGRILEQGAPVSGAARGE